MRQQLGKLIPPGAAVTNQKGAVTVGTLECLAEAPLWPGTGVRVRLGGDGTYFAGIDTDDDKEAHGIVDPYLKRRINPGERFLVLINPDNLNELLFRDIAWDWVHPEIPDNSIRASCALPQERADPGRRKVSENYMRALALFLHNQGVDIDYHRVLRAGDEYADRPGLDTSLTTYKFSLDKDFNSEWGDWKDYWHHWSTLTRRAIPVEASNLGAPFRQLPA